MKNKFCKVGFYTRSAAVYLGKQDSCEICFRFSQFQYLSVTDKDRQGILKAASLTTNSDKWVLNTTNFSVLLSTIILMDELNHHFKNKNFIHWYHSGGFLFRSEWLYFCSAMLATALLLLYSCMFTIIWHLGRALCRIEMCQADIH